MAFCIKDNLMNNNDCTVLDNSFLLQVLPEAPGDTLKVYMLGLVLTNDPNNSLEYMAEKLGLTPQEVLDAYLYWQELSLVQIINTDPVQVVYLNPKGKEFIEKVNPLKYKKFNKTMQQQFSRMIGINEWHDYYNFLERTSFQHDALVAVAKYCVGLKGDSLSHNYVLAVANSQLNKGNTSLESVAESLTTQSKFDADIKLVLKSNKSTRRIEHNDRVLFEKWTNWGFALDVICSVAKDCPVGDFSKLDKYLQEYYKNGVLSSKEIADFSADKKHRFDLAKDICKNLGVFYQVLDPVVENYVSPWLNKGFDDDTLNQISKLCFKSGLRTLTAMADRVEKFHKSGRTTIESINQYIEQVAKTDGEIKKLLSLCGIERGVASNDRSLYKLWTKDWSFSRELVEYVATLSQGASNPFAYMGKILSNCKQQGVTTVEGVKALTLSTTTLAKPTKTMAQRDYTKDEVDAMFSNLDDVEF